MSRIIQLQVLKNIALTNKLAEYISVNPSVIKNLPHNVSFVIFTAKDLELNKLNSQIFESLHEKGEPVVKVEETENKSSPWKFTSYIR